MISVDIETSGLSPQKNSILSIGAVHVETGAEFYMECHVQEGKEISEKALEVNGFTHDEVYDPTKPDPWWIVERFVDWAEKIDSRGYIILMGQNFGQFDMQFLKTFDSFNESERISYRCVDLFSMGHALTGEFEGGWDLCQRFGIDPEPKPHNALEGARQNVRVYNHLHSMIHDHGKEDIGSWIITSSGMKLDFADPTPEMISLEDISHGLANTCRFAGQGQEFFSVGLHSIMVAEVVKTAGASPVVQLQALMHDAHEAYVCDIPSPAKHVLPDYQRLEKVLAKAIGGKFDIDLVNLPKIVKWADRQQLFWEAKQFFTEEQASWAGEVESEYLNEVFLPYFTHTQVKMAFQEKYYELKQEINDTKNT